MAHTSAVGAFSFVIINGTFELFVQKCSQCFSLIVLVSYSTDIDTKTYFGAKNKGRPWLCNDSLSLLDGLLDGVSKPHGYHVPYLSALDFSNSPVWNVEFDELDFLFSLKNQLLQNHLFRNQFHWVRLCNVWCTLFRSRSTYGPISRSTTK